jgi:hypothetical protein
MVEVFHNGIHAINTCLCTVREGDHSYASNRGLAGASLDASFMVVIQIDIRGHVYPPTDKL